MGPVWTECLNGLLFIFLFAHLGCTSVDDPDGRVCDLETSGDTFCSGTLLERCHAVDEMAGHLHSTDCGLDGYSCVELDERNATCADETVGYVVIESGSGTIGGRAYTAALGGDTIRGVGDSPPYSYTHSGLSSA